MGTKRMVAALGAAVLMMIMALTVSTSPAQAGLTTNPNYNVGGWADVSLNFNTTLVKAGSYRMNWAQVCMSPGDQNTKELKAGGNIQVRGSNGALITNMYVPRVGRTSCVAIVPNPSSLTTGAGAVATYSGVVNIDGWIPYPDVPFSFCRGVVQTGGCG